MGPDRDPRVPGDVKAVHRRYVDVGLRRDLHRHLGVSRPRSGTARPDCGRPASRSTGWTSRAAESAWPARRPPRRGRDDEVAVAFSINGDVDTPDGRETIRLLARAFEHDPPDLILVETLTLVRSSTYATVEALLDTGLPVWLSFRRCRHGVCGVYGEHWGGPEGDAFGRAARRFEEMGVGALAINCLPPDHVTGMLAWLRDFTDLPLGVYPNLGYLSAAGWRHEAGVGADRVRRAGPALARGGRADRRRLLRRRPRPDRRGAGRARPTPSPATPGPTRCPTRASSPSRSDSRRRPDAGWSDARGPAACTRSTSPTSRSSPACSSPPRAASWSGSTSTEEGVGAHQRCLDIGCGSGLLTVQLARNGAAHVHAIDIEPGRGQEHAHQRVSQRRGRPRQRGRAGPLPVGPGGALRRHRGQPLPDPGRSVRAGRLPPSARLLGRGACSTTCSGCCPRRWPTTAPHT